MLTIINGEHILSQSRIADELINKAFVKIPQIVNADGTSGQFEQCHSAVTGFVNMRVPPMVEFNIHQVTTIYVLKELNIGVPRGGQGVLTHPFSWAPPFHL